MVNFTSGLWLYATVVLFACLLLLLRMKLSRLRPRELEFLIIALVAGGLLFAYEGIPLATVMALEFGIVSFNGLLAWQSQRLKLYYVFASIAYLVLLHWITFTFLAQAMLLGLLSCITNIRQYKNRFMNRRVEVERDMVHIAAGALLMSVFYFETTPIAVTTLMVIILGGISAIGIAEMWNGSFSSMVFRFERNGASLGHGALWLALGALLPVAFLNTTGVLVVFSAIFIGDPLATIIGIRIGGLRLPYNSSKSLSGTAAYFLSASVLSFMLVGWYGIVFGLVAAIVESVKLRLDDNFTVSLVLVALALALGI